jgi:hypothetical protein
MISCFSSRASGTRSSEHGDIRMSSIYDRRMVAGRPRCGKRQVRRRSIVTERAGLRQIATR